jgi:hypothetical protein
MVDTKDEIISYQKLRTFIGMIGVLLPILLVLGCYIRGDKSYSWQPSISHYYYSKMHVAFVCVLCVLGGFLITYKGKGRLESWISNFAGCFAVAVAAFPTGFDDFRLAPNKSNQYLQLLNPVSGTWDKIHFGFAGLLFSCFAIFCLCFFQIPDRNYDTPQEQKKFARRKRLYKICGWGIIISMAAIFLFFVLLPQRQGLLAYTTFFFETTSLYFFGAAWLVKGSVLWKRYPVFRKLIKPLR